jgi:hypothetical protein
MTSATGYPRMPASQANSELDSALAGLVCVTRRTCDTIESRRLGIRLGREQHVRLRSDGGPVGGPNRCTGIPLS